MALEWGKRSGAVAAVALTGAMLAGCAQPIAVQCDFTPFLTAQRSPGPAMAPMVPGTMQEVPLNAVAFTDRRITDRVLVQSLSASRNDAGRVQVTTRMVNCTDTPIQVEARTQFMDSGQAPTEPVSVWKRVFLSPRAFAIYQESSMDAQKVALYLVELKGADPR